MSRTRTLSPFLAKLAATFKTLVDFPTPPFSETNAMDLISKALPPWAIGRGPMGLEAFEAEDPRG